MRQECRHYESRTYANGDTVRKCNIDRAPNAPWRCPEPCQSFEIRLDAGWTYGTMVGGQAPPEPPGIDDGSAAAVLDQAEDVINSIGSQVLAEARAAYINSQRPARGWRRLFRRR